CVREGEERGAVAGAEGDHW
nr:immunoglobulin heavy chain junction region [Macaca mulatta]MOX02678.1 immunoglobulin heavy chain junction region [Macaca mulatta]MOX03666.1 immunoglobulin heavy chain junction region [Macaca mulatta]MOX04106.1 immunoglobulin heavy chain junction region [Macaca mulatta]MOX04396.1 immunoglobulin heavy chain junction region [Macaca mulatta]